MHEWSIALMILDALDELARSEGLSEVSFVEISYGSVMELDGSLLKEALEELSKGGPYERTEFSVVEEPTKFKCLRCGEEWSFTHELIEGDRKVLEGGMEESSIHFIPELAPALIRCPRCHSRDFQIVSGKGIRVSRLEGSR